jgi:hypothetical protein
MVVIQAKQGERKMTTITTIITREQLDDILDAAGLCETDEPADRDYDWGDSDGDAVDIREDYSGRGMYGDTCLGIVVSSQRTAFRLVACMTAVLGIDTTLDITRKAATDNMGRDMIVYFPGVTLDA